MYKSIPKEKLPKDYGGDNSSMKTLNGKFRLNKWPDGYFLETIPGTATPKA